MKRIILIILVCLSVQSSIIANSFETNTINPSSMYKKTEDVNNQVTYPKNFDFSDSSITPSSNQTSKPASATSNSTKISQTNIKFVTQYGPLDSLAIAVLSAFEKNNSTKAEQYQEKMIKSGVEGFTSPRIIFKKTPKCPPVKMEINGEKISGSMCANFGYIYKGKTYIVGYCK